MHKSFYNMDMKESLYSFGGGFMMAILGNYTWLAQIGTGTVQGLVIEWTIKVFGTMILGVLGGLAGLFAKDLYKYLKDRYND
jgi:hypothetical protein